jgi:hypothetical protein
MKRVAIERKKNLQPADFVRDHHQNGGMPVIVTDAMDCWPARSKWSFEYFRSVYGSDFISVPVDWLSDVGKVTKLATYIDYLGRPIKDLPGFWINIRDGRPLGNIPELHATAFHLRGWYASWFAFEAHPELYDDIKPAPYFVADWVLALNSTLRDVFEWTSGRTFWALYAGPEGTLSPLHFDFWETHAYLAQIKGTKRVMLFSPKDSEFLYGGRVNPEQPDLACFPLFDRATAYEGTIEPGDVVFMPAGWWHCVRALEKSITVSHNFFNDVNVNEHLSHFLRRIPTLVGGFDQSPGWRHELGVEWCAKDLANAPSPAKSDTCAAAEKVNMKRPEGFST